MFRVCLGVTKGSVGVAVLLAAASSLHLLVLLFSFPSSLGFALSVPPVLGARSSLVPSHHCIFPGGKLVFDVCVHFLSVRSFPVDTAWVLVLPVFIYLLTQSGI